MTWIAAGRFSCDRESRGVHFVPFPSEDGRQDGKASSWSILTCWRVDERRDMGKRAYGPGLVGELRLHHVSYLVHSMHEGVVMMLLIT